MDDPVRDLLDARLNRQLSRRSFLRAGALTVLGSGAFLAACSSSSSTPSPAATGPAAATSGSSTPPSAAATPSAGASLGGPLNFIGYDGEDARNVAKPFFTSNGITMQPTFIADAFEPLTRFKTGAKGQLDIISDNKDFQRAVLAANQELFQPIDMARLPNAAGLLPAFANAPWLTKDGKVYGIPLIWGDEPCIYNPKKWDGVPARYTDFADAKYKGELVLVDDPIANTWLFAKSLGMAQPNRLTQAQLDQTMAAMAKIKANIVTFSATLGDQADVLIRGDASMGIGGWAYQVLLAKQKGVTLVTANPSTDGTYYWSDAYAIAVGAPHVDNAYAFIDFMMSPASNAAIATELGSGVTIAKAVDQLDATNKGLYDYGIVGKADGLLATQVVSPPQNDEADVVGVAKWQKAWQNYKLG